MSSNTSDNSDEVNGSISAAHHRYKKAKSNVCTTGRMAIPHNVTNSQPPTITPAPDEYRPSVPILSVTNDPTNGMFCRINSFSGSLAASEIPQETAPPAVMKIEYAATIEETTANSVVRSMSESFEYEMRGFSRVTISNSNAAVTRGNNNLSAKNTAPFANNSRAGWKLRRLSAFPEIAMPAVKTG